MIYGYARCSTNEDKQDIQRQVRELKAAGAEQVYLEYEHGDSVVKEQLAALLEQANAGDTILTLEVSRLARSTKQLCDIIETVKDKRLRLSIVGSIQVEIIRERVRSGMRNAAAKGVKIGRPQTTLDDIPANFLRHYPQYKKGAFNLTELARLCAISRTTAYKYIGLLEG